MSAAANDGQAMLVPLPEPSKPEPAPERLDTRRLSKRRRTPPGPNARRIVKLLRLLTADGEDGTRTRENLRDLTHWALWEVDRTLNVAKLKLKLVETVGSLGRYRATQAGLAILEMDEAKAETAVANLITMMVAATKKSAAEVALSAQQAAAQRAEVEAELERLAKRKKRSKSRAERLALESRRKEARDAVNAWLRDTRPEFRGSLTEEQREALYRIVYERRGLL